MAPRKRLEKILRYRLPLADTDPAGAMASAAEHWRGFSWEAGPVAVSWKSDVWPTIQVWGATEDEAKRVIRHALAHMEASEADGEYFSAAVSNPRYGRIATVRARLCSARGGPGGITPHRFIWQDEPPPIV